MRNVTFQLVLKECVLPNYFVFNKLKNLLEQRSEFSEFDMQQAATEKPERRMGGA